MSDHAAPTKRNPVDPWDEPSIPPDDDEGVVLCVPVPRLDVLLAAEQERDELKRMLAEQAALVEAAVAYGAECEAHDAAEQAWRDAPHGDEVTQRARDSSMDQLEQAHDELTEAAVAYYRARQAEQGGAPADGSGCGRARGDNLDVPSVRL